MIGDPAALSASAAAARIRQGELTSVALVEACLARIATREPVVHAWAHLDPEQALNAARACDATPPSAPLHGVPVGIKDVIDTADMVTAYGSPAFARHRPATDAACVARLREAGAIILGKTVTAEFATYHPGPTVNPIDPARTPGGSSSGSAAAVADRHVPLALGTQTVGSMLRPGSFCGIHGFKPSFDRYPTAGTLTTSPALDTLGVFARDLVDLLLIDEVLVPSPAAPPPTRPDAVLIARTAAWDQAEPAMQAALAGCADALAEAGVEVVKRPLPPVIDRLLAAQAIIHKHEVWRSLGAIRRAHANVVSQAFAALVDEGGAITPEVYATALELQREARAALPALFDGVAAILTPSAPGIAPRGLASTGDPVFSRIWTALGTPCIGFPWGADEGMPLGLQLVGRVDDDRGLIAFASRLLGRIGVRRPELAT